MKVCTVYGDMSADSMDDVYPSVLVCNECVRAFADDEDSPIVTVDSDDVDYGDECSFCQKTREEEQQEEEEE